MTDNLDELRHIEGFPIGEDEDLHALSDPPHYTAYPNPHVSEFIEKWGTLYDEATDDYHREPYVADVSEGKNDPIYNVHSYHTKVPYKAIVPFIEHYTEPGDIIFDGFCGSGMTGVAAQMVGRRAILCDLSPAATFIAYNYNMPVDVSAFKHEATRILAEVETECAWMYETWHRHCDTPNQVKGRINYIVWSDVFVCPYCSEEIIFWDAAVDPKAGKVQKTFACPSCKARVTKREVGRATEQAYDTSLHCEVQRAKKVPVLINYSVKRTRYGKRPDADDLALVRTVEKSEIPYWYPSYPMMFKGSEWGDSWRAGYHMSVTHVHHFYTNRNLWTSACLWEKIQQVDDSRTRLALAYVFTAATQVSTRMSSFRYDSRNPRNTAGGILKGTLYIPSGVI